MTTAQPQNPLVTLEHLKLERNVIENVIEAAILVGCSDVVAAVLVSLSAGHVLRVDLIPTAGTPLADAYSRVQEFLRVRFNQQVALEKFSCPVPEPPPPNFMQGVKIELKTRKTKADVSRIGIEHGSPSSHPDAYMLGCVGVYEVETHLKTVHGGGGPSSIELGLKVDTPLRNVTELLAHCRKVMASQPSDRTVTFTLNGLPLLLDEPGGLLAHEGVLAVSVVEQKKTHDMAGQELEGEKLPPAPILDVEEAATALGAAVSAKMLAATLSAQASPGQLHEMLELLGRQLTGARGPLIEAVNQALSPLEGQSFGSFEKNQAVVNDLSEFARAFGLRFECQKPACAMPSALVLLPGNARDGAFAFRHSGTNHGGRATLPTLRVIPVGDDPKP